MSSRSRVNALERQLKRLKAKRGYRSPFPDGDPEKARVSRRFFDDSPIPEAIWAEYELQRIMLGIDPELESIFRSSINPGFFEIVFDSGASNLYKSHVRGGWVFRLYGLMIYAPEEVALEAADVVRQIQLRPYSDELPDLELGEILAEILKKWPDGFFGLFDVPELDLTPYKIIPSPPGIIPLDFFAKQSLSESLVKSHAECEHLMPESLREKLCCCWPIVRQDRIARRDGKSRPKKEIDWDKLHENSWPPGWPKSG